MHGLYWKRYTHRMRSGDETKWFCAETKDYSLSIRLHCPCAVSLKGAPQHRHYIQSHQTRILCINRAWHVNPVIWFSKHGDPIEEYTTESSLIFTGDHGYKYQLHTWTYPIAVLMSLCQNTAPFRDRINKRELLDHSLWLATSHVKQLQKLGLLDLPNSHHEFIPQNVEPLWCTKRQDCLLSCQLTTCSATLELATSSHLKTR